MRTLLGCTALGLLVGLLGCGSGTATRKPDPGPPPVAWSDDMQAVADGNNRFACDLYGKLRDGEKGNLFFSPYSVHTALSMTATGAKGNTRAEMVKVLHLPADENKLLASGDLGRFYGHPRADYDFSVANALWGQKGFPWRPDWLAVQNDRFGAGFQEADFANDPEAERVRINRWVEEKTRDKIKELLEPGIVVISTTMVLTNAVYFKGKWGEQFDPNRTRDEPFRLANGTTTTVPMMHTTGKRRYGVVEANASPANQTQILELPYQGGELSMVIVLPPKPGGLAAVEKQLTAGNLTKWIGGLNEIELDVTMPRFRMETKAELPKYLKTLGMIDAFFDGKADFTGMATAPPGYIYAVVHKAFVEVNEEGTEAAAATAVAMQPRSATIKPSFVADHPFLFLIRDAKHGTILFLGRVEKP